MISIRPVYTSYEREEYLKPFGITPKDGYTVICARNDGKFVGTAYVSSENEGGIIHFLSLIDGYDDYVDKFLLGKAALNFLDLDGAKSVTYNADDEKLATNLGFKKIDGEYKLSLVGYFDANHDCDGKCKNSEA